MSGIQGMNDPNYISKQYRDSSNLNARIRLHQQFSTNTYGWQRWLFDQIKFEPESRVLELGCGTGELWLENSDRIPKGLEVIVSDFSEGMVAQVQKNLKKLNRSFQFKVIDAQSIPFKADQFDIVIANHMLFHLPDREKGLSEIKRVLKPAGWLYASTIGSTHLKEINDLVTRFEPLFSTWNTLATDSFSLENGSAQLEQFFSQVMLTRYADSLMVTEKQPLIDYIFSGRLQLSDERKVELIKFIEHEFEIMGGAFFVSKNSGVFEGKK
ncbi:MAG: class I SAM-dependent methyltransferase [Anaerolinea sp.]|nr:class I SAM-dependent methyltransferase [Anaerolinea sp.]